MDFVPVHKFQSLTILHFDPKFRLRGTTVSKSLPNIHLPFKIEEDDEIIFHRKIFPSGNCGITSSFKKHQRPKILKKTWDKVKTIIHSTSSTNSRRGSLRKPDGQFCRPNCSSAPATPSHSQKAVFEFDLQLQQGNITPDLDSHTHTPDPDRDSEHEDTEKIQRNYALLQKRLSEELHQRMNEYKADPRHVTENLSEEFKKKLQQWEMWKASTGKVTYTDEELQLILPEDFSKKLHEWECIKTGVSNTRLHSSRGHEISSSGSGSKHASSSAGMSTTSTDTGNIKSSKCSRKKKSSDSSRQKELAWLEKQLEKIDAEKKRLERELKKYTEREERLAKMKEALKNSPQEVWIRTPTANCKVEKLTEKFAKKLYEWEERQGIQPESSTMALLNPKYYGPPPQTELTVPGFHIESETDKSLLEEPSSLHEREEREDSTEVHSMEICDHISSAASSSDYEEATDSFATHDKGNSGASNTDSDFYRTEPGGSRRRSSDAISTPLSARSPSLSAFTSDDEGEPYGLLKTVDELKEEEAEAIAVMKHTGSQTIKAEPIVVEDDESIGSSQAHSLGTEIFVPTKRTIFKPIVNDAETENVVIIEQEQQLKSPSLVRNLIRTSNERKFSIPEVGERASLLPPISPSTTQVPRSQISPIWSRLDENRPCSSLAMYKSNVMAPPLPRIVGAIPKSNPGAQQIRSFPKMGKIPVWCSPIGARRHFIRNNNVPQSCFPTSASVNGLSHISNDQHEFSLDKFLKESELLIDSCLNYPERTIKSVQHDTKLLSPSACSNRLSVTNTTRQSGQYTIGGGFPPAKPLRTSVLARSNSFGIRREPQHGIVPVECVELSLPVQEVELQQSTMNLAVTKSRSTGSIIKDKFSRALSLSKKLNLASLASFGSSQNTSQTVHVNSNNSVQTNSQNHNHNRALPSWLAGGSKK